MVDEHGKGVRSSSRQAVRGSSYIDVPRRLYVFDDAARRSTAMSFLDWQKKPGRPWADVEEDDTRALGQLICWVSRPSRPDLSLKHLHAYANEGVRTATKLPYPRFATNPRKKRSEVAAVFRTLDRLFRRGLRAGQALEHVWHDCISPDEFGQVLTNGSEAVFGFDYLPPHSDERKKVWSEFIPAIHVAMAMRTALIDHGYDVDDSKLAEGALTAELLAEPPPAGWISRILVDAEEWSYRMYYQDLIPEPERMVHLNFRQKDLAINLGNFPP